MNNIHQVIFKKFTQQLVVVSELTKSAGKPNAVSASSVDIISISYFRGVNRATGRQPDMSWPGTKMWSDLTTPNQWNAHVRKYHSQYGEGIPILYKPHVGVVNSYKLRSGASAILNGGEAGYNILIKDSEEK